MIHSPPKPLFRIVTGLAGLAIIVTIVLVLITFRTPTAQDLRISNQIRLEFEQSINLAQFQHLNIVSSPRRNGTILIVSGIRLTEEEKQTLAVQARQISRKHNDRQVAIVFRN
jgi:hypothetical protein